jgi:RNA polymerase-binding transcription factor DksA
MAKDKPSKKETRPARKPAAKPEGKEGKSASKSGSSASTSGEIPAPAPAAPKKPAVSQFRKEFEPFRQMLVAKRKSIVGDLAGMRDEVMGRSQQDASGDLSKMPIDMADVGSDSYEREFTISLIEGDQIQLAEIEEALQRMEAGTYFNCSNPECGKEIPKARLEIKPHAKFCIECQKKHEKGLL